VRPARLRPPGLLPSGFSQFHENAPNEFLHLRQRDL
jgi:hypothetical protein